MTITTSENYWQLKYPANLEKMCETTNQLTDMCIRDAQDCVQHMQEFDRKNREFEKKFQICLNKNKANSDRNNELQKRLDALQSQNREKKSHA
jgi:hypothetical protein